MWPPLAALRRGPERAWGPPGGTSSAPSTRHEGCQPLAPRAEGFMLFPTRLWQPEPPSPSPCHYPGSRRCLRKTAQLRCRGRRRSTGSSLSQGQGARRSQEGWEKGEWRNSTAKPIPKGYFLPIPQWDASVCFSGVRPESLGAQITCALCVSPTSQP